MPPRITREERITFYRMILQQINIAEPYHDPNGVFNQIVEFLQANPANKQEFMRFSHVTGQTNSFHARVHRMIRDVYHTNDEFCQFTF